VRWLFERGSGDLSYGSVHGWRTPPWQPMVAERARRGDACLVITTGGVEPRASRDGGFVQRHAVGTGRPDRDDQAHAA
jgi:hypothetical protein